MYNLLSCEVFKYKIIRGFIARHDTSQLLGRVSYTIFIYPQPKVGSIIDEKSINIDKITLETARPYVSSP